MTLVWVGPGQAAQTSGLGGMHSLVREASDVTKAVWDTLDPLTGDPRLGHLMLSRQPGSSNLLGTGLSGAAMRDDEPMDWLDDQATDSAFGCPDIWTDGDAVPADLAGFAADPTLPRWSSDEWVLPGTHFALPDLPADFPMLEDHLTEAEARPSWPALRQAALPEGLERRPSYRPVCGCQPRYASLCCSCYMSAVFQLKRRMARLRRRYRKARKAAQPVGTARTAAIRWAPPEHRWSCAWHFFLDNHTRLPRCRVQDVSEDIRRASVCARLEPALMAALQLAGISLTKQAPAEHIRILTDSTRTEIQAFLQALELSHLGDADWAQIAAGERESAIVYMLPSRAVHTADEKLASVHAHKSHKSLYCSWTVVCSSSNSRATTSTKALAHQLSWAGVTMCGT